jgi:4-diphosphocytidyl-2-C-methyl-D-erythritol kinase
MTFHSPAKINLWLRVLGKRPDGFHEVETRLCRLALGDLVEVEHRGMGTAVSLTCSEPTVPLDESNLAMKALRAFESRTGRPSSWRIHLEKKIPAGAGLGGGSGNAATVLKACNELTGNPLSLEQLIELGGQIGSDVPCFLLDTPAADGSGRGEQVTPRRVSLASAAGADQAAVSHPHALGLQALGRFKGNSRGALRSAALPLGSDGERPRTSRV